MNNIRHSSEHTSHFTPEWLVEKARFTLGGIDLDPASSAFANEVVRATTYYTEEQNGLLVPGGWRGRTFLNAPGGLVDSAGQRVVRPKCTETGSCGLPPGHRHEGVTSSAVTWWRALCGEWAAGRVTAAIFVGFSIELLQSCQGGPDPGHHPLDFPCCFPKERIKFDVVKDGKRVSGTAPTHSNVIVLLPAIEHVRNLEDLRLNQSGHGETDVNMLARFDEAFGPVGYVHRGNGQYA